MRLKRILQSTLSLVASATVWIGCVTAQTPVLLGGPMMGCPQLPCVDVTVEGGAHLRMLIDTGNPQSTLNITKANELGIPTKPMIRPNGEAYDGLFVGLLENVTLGGVHLGEVRVLVTDLDTPIHKGQYPPSDGSLAYTVSDGRILQLNYKMQRIRISEVLKVDTPCPASCGDLTTPTFGKHGPPILVTTGFQVNRKPVLLQIDTLYSGTMVIYPTSVHKLNLQANEYSIKTRFFPFTDGGVKMIECTGPSETFMTKRIKRGAALYFATPKVHLPDGLFDGTVGHELLAGSILTIDFKAHHVWVQ